MLVNDEHSFLLHVKQIFHEDSLKLYAPLNSFEDKISWFFTSKKYCKQTRKPITMNFVSESIIFHCLIKVLI